MTVQGFGLINIEAAFLMCTKAVSKDGREEHETALRWPPRRQLDRDAETRTLLIGRPHSWAYSPHSPLTSRCAVLSWGRVCGGQASSVCVCVCTQSCPTLYDSMDCVTRQTPLSMGFPRQECWGGLLFPSPGDLSDPGIEPRSPALQVVSCIVGEFFTDWATRKPVSQNHW